MLEVVYLVFNEGYAATASDDWVRPALCEDALRLGRVLAGLLPREPEVLGLVALIEIQASRLRARVGPAGEPILLLDQDRGRWDHLLIRRGLAALARVEALGGALGPYELQAAIAARHAMTGPQTRTIGAAAGVPGALHLAGTRSAVGSKSLHQGPPLPDPFTEQHLLMAALGAESSPPPTETARPLRPPGSYPASAVASARFSATQLSSV